MWSFFALSMGGIFLSIFFLCVALWHERMGPMQEEALAMSPASHPACWPSHTPACAVFEDMQHGTWKWLSSWLQPMHGSHP